MLAAMCVPMLEVMDGDSAYAALSRHRDRGISITSKTVRGQRRLIRSLSRYRAKDMASDYANEQERQFAERRGITLRECVTELVRKVPEKVRGMFEGLQLRVMRSNMAPLSTKAAPASAIMTSPYHRSAVRSGASKIWVLRARLRYAPSLLAGTGLDICIGQLAERRAGGAQVKI